MKAEDVAEWHDRSDAIKRAMNGVQKTSHAEQAAAIRALIAERNALLDERQRFEARLFDMAETGDKARAERDALREALNRARRQSVAMLDYEHRVPDALAHQMYAQLHQIDAALEPRK